MTTARALALSAFVALTPVAAFAQAEYPRPHPMAVTHTIAFPGCCPRPDWWEEVEIDRPVTTPAEFLAMWQDRSLTDRQKAKAMFRAIEQYHRNDLDIAVPALTYYYSVDRKYAHIRRLYEFGAAAYIDFDRSLENYGGESGDLSAGLINRLAQIYLREDLPERAEPLLDYMIRVRGDEINDHLLETASVHLGEALLRMDRSEDAVAMLIEARRAYDGDWEKRIDEQLARTRDAMGWRYYLHDTRLSLPIGIAVAAVVLVLLLRLGGRDRARRPN